MPLPPSPSVSLFTPYCLFSGSVGGNEVSSPHFSQNLPLCLLTALVSIELSSCPLVSEPCDPADCSCHASLPVHTQCGRVVRHGATGEAREFSTGFLSKPAGHLGSLQHRRKSSACVRVNLRSLAHPRACDYVNTLISAFHKPCDSSLIQSGQYCSSEAND